MRTDWRGVALVVTVGVLLGAVAGGAYARARGRQEHGAPHATAEGPAAVPAAAAAATTITTTTRPTAATAATATAAHELHVPRATGALTIDGELDDAFWRAPPARTGAFLAGGIAARPYSDARVARTDDALVFALYAADEDMRGSTDAFHLHFDTPLGARDLDVYASGATHGDLPGVRAGRDFDGTLDDPSDDDEEWVVEIVVPFASLGIAGRDGERIGFSIERCDTPKTGIRTCSGFGRGTAPGAIVLGGPRS